MRCRYRSLQSDSSLRCCGFIEPPASSPAAHAEFVEFELSTLDSRFGYEAAASQAPTNGCSWQVVMIHVCTGNRTFGNAFAPRRKLDRAVADTSPGRILVDPQLDESPTWNPTSTPVIASHETRARSSVRRHRSSSETSGRFASSCRWSAGRASSLSATWESTASCAAAILSASDCGTSATATKWHRRPW